MSALANEPPPLQLQGTNTRSQTPGDGGPGGPQPVALENAVRDGSIRCALKGDGKTTTHCQLELENLTGKDMIVSVEACQNFRPSAGQYQNMITTQKCTIKVPAWQKVATEIPTLCASSKNVSPPPGESIAYKPADHPDAAVGQMLPLIVDAAKSLDGENAFRNVPVPPERRQQTIAQLAIWREVGDRTPDPGDDVTAAVIKGDVVQAGQIDEKTLTRKQRDNLMAYASGVFNAVDITVKRARKSQIASATGGKAGGGKPGAIAVARPDPGTATAKQETPGKTEPPAAEPQPASPASGADDSVLQYLDESLNLPARNADERAWSYLLRLSRCADFRHIDTRRVERLMQEFSHVHSAERVVDEDDPDSIVFLGKDEHGNTMAEFRVFRGGSSVYLQVGWRLGSALLLSAVDWEEGRHEQIGDSAERLELRDGRMMTVLYGPDGGIIGWQIPGPPRAANRASAPRSGEKRGKSSPKAKGPSIVEAATPDADLQNLLTRISLAALMDAPIQPQDVGRLLRHLGMGGVHDTVRLASDSDSPVQRFRARDESGNTVVDLAIYEDGSICLIRPRPPGKYDYATAANGMPGDVLLCGRLLWPRLNQANRQYLSHAPGVLPGSARGAGNGYGELALAVLADSSLSGAFHNLAPGTVRRTLGYAAPGLQPASDRLKISSKPVLRGYCSGWTVPMPVFVSAVQTAGSSRPAVRLLVKPAPGS